MKHIVKTFCLLALGMLGLWACSDDDGATDEYSDWQARNEAYFASQMATARTAIAAAKQAGFDCATVFINRQPVEIPL